MKILDLNPALNMFFHKLGKPMLTYILGVKRQPLAAIRFQRYPMYNLYFILTPCTTCPINIKYCTTFPAWAKCFHFVLQPAIYIVIAVGLHFYYKYDVAHLQLQMGLSARALSVPFQIK